MSLVASSLLIGWAASVSVVSAVAAGRALRRRAPTTVPPCPGPTPRVVVMRPCAGTEPHLRRSLASTASLRYDGPWRLVLSTSTVDDPARPVLLEVAASLRERGLSVDVVVVPPSGPNRKASQLAGQLDDAEDELGLVVDSDVDLAGLDLNRMLAPLRDASSRVAAVWCPPVEREVDGLGDRMSVALLGGSMHAFPVLGALDPRGLVGKTVALRLDALREIGGFAGLRRYLGEDMELSARLRAAGWTTTMAHQCVTSLASGRTVGRALARYARWLLVIRAQRPALLASYPLLLAATPGLVLACGLGWVLGIAGASWALGLTVVSRLLLGVVARRSTGHSLRPSAVAMDALLADPLLLAAFARATFGPARIRWRGHSLRIKRGGRLEDAPKALSGPQTA